MMLHERSSSDRSQWDSSSGEHEWTLYQSVYWMFYLYKWSHWILRFILRATWMSVTNGTAWCLEPWRRRSDENILALFNHSASIIKAFWSFLVWPIFLYIWLSWIASHNVYLHCITWRDQSLIFIFQLLSSCWCFVECWCFFYTSQCMFNVKCLNLQHQQDPSQGTATMSEASLLKLTK